MGTKKSVRGTEKQKVIERLREWLKPGDTVYTILRRVSRSGMSRVISFIKIDSDAERAQHGRVSNSMKILDYNIALACDYKQVDRGDGLKVGGCGQDMGFAVVYNLGRTLFPQGVSAKCSRCGLYPMHREDDGKLMANRDDHGDLYAYGPCAGWNRDTEPEGEFYGHEFYGRNGDQGPWENDGGYALNQRWL